MTAREPGPFEGRERPRQAGGFATDEGEGESYDYVGLVMSKSDEGDALVRVLEGRDNVEIIENPTFWDIRAKDRLVVDFDELSDELGFEIDGYAIQHEMSTHYGRLVTTDDALMLFSDPTEAMEYLTG